MSSRPDLVVDWCSYEAAKYAVEHWHYSKTIPVSKPTFIGVWESGYFIGSIIYALGASPSLGSPYGLSMWECCELVRVALSKHKNEVTKIISIATRLLKNNNPGLRLVVSFADPYHGHLGKIYQAGNWYYVGKSSPSKMLKLNSMLIDIRRYNGHGWNKKKMPPEEANIIDVPGKHRYILPLDKAMRRQIAPLAKPYPKVLDVRPADGS